MSQTKVAYLLLLVLAGCSSGGPGSGTASNVSPTPAPAGTPVSTNPASDAGNEGPAMEGPAMMMYRKVNGTNWGPLHLKPSESAGLRQAIANTPSGAKSPHLHADVENGQLAFRAEQTQNPSHLTGNEPSVVIGQPGSKHASAPVAIVATPDAQRLLEERTKNPGH
jgi:hypothetical protein